MKVDLCITFTGFKFSGQLDLCLFMLRIDYIHHSTNPHTLTMIYEQFLKY